MSRKIKTHPAYTSTSHARADKSTMVTFTIFAGFVAAALLAFILSEAFGEKLMAVGGDNSGATAVSGTNPSAPAAASGATAPQPSAATKAGNAKPAANSNTAPAPNNTGKNNNGATQGSATAGATNQ